MSTAKASAHSARHTREIARAPSRRALRCRLARVTARHDRKERTPRDAASVCSTQCRHCNWRQALCRRMAAPCLTRAASTLAMSSQACACSTPPKPKPPHTLACYAGLRAADLGVKESASCQAQTGLHRQPVGHASTVRPGRPVHAPPAEPINAQRAPCPTADSLNLRPLHHDLHPSPSSHIPALALVQEVLAPRRGPHGAACTLLHAACNCA